MQPPLVSTIFCWRLSFHMVCSEGKLSKLRLLLCLTLPRLGFFENGRTEWGSKWPSPLKFLNNKVKRLKLVSNLGNHINFLKIYQKTFCDEIFWWRQHFCWKIAKLGVNLKYSYFINQKSYHNDWYHIGKYLVYTCDTKMIYS